MLTSSWRWTTHIFQFFKSTSHTLQRTDHKTSSQITTLCDIQCVWGEIKLVCIWVSTITRWHHISANRQVKEVCIFGRSGLHSFCWPKFIGLFADTSSRLWIWQKQTSADNTMLVTGWWQFQSPVLTGNNNLQTGSCILYSSIHSVANSRLWLNWVTLKYECVYIHKGEAGSFWKAYLLSSFKLPSHLPSKIFTCYITDNVKSQ